MDAARRCDFLSSSKPFVDLAQTHFDRSGSLQREIFPAHVARTLGRREHRLRNVARLIQSPGLGQQNAMDVVVVQLNRTVLRVGVLTLRECSRARAELEPALDIVQL